MFIYFAIYIPFHIPITIAAAIKLRNDQAKVSPSIPQELQYYDESIQDDDAQSNENDPNPNMQEPADGNDSEATIHIWNKPLSFIEH